VGQPGELDRVCTLAFRDQTISVSPIGGGELVGSGTKFSLPYDSALTERIYSAPYHGDLLVLFDVSNGEQGWGGIARLQPPDFHVVWHVKIPSSNVGPAAIDGSSLYVSAAGFVARVDLEGGRYLWQHGGLYDATNQRFNAFLVPLVTRSEALFYEQVGLGATSRAPKVVRVQKDSGAFVIEDSE
jgi:outer membrane protein assembly factor BamB